MTAPTLNGTAAGTASHVSVVSATFTTDLPNDIICVMAYAGGLGTGLPAPTITSVTSPSLTFTLRAQANVSGGQGDLELWWALAASPLSAEVITVTYTSEFDDAALAVFGVTGCDTSNPWDPDGFLPFGATSSAASTLPVSPINTLNADDFLIFGWGTGANNTIGTVPTGFTELVYVPNTGGTQWGILGIASQGVSAPLSGASFSWGSTLASLANDSTGYIFDALTAPAVVPGTVVLTGVSGTGVPGSVGVPGAPSTVALSGLSSTAAVGIVTPNSAVPGVVFGTVAMRLPVPKLSAAGGVRVAQVVIRLPVPKLVVTGSPGVSGTVGLALGVPTLTMTGSSVAGRVAMRLPAMRVGVTARAGVIGTVGLRLPVPQITAASPNTMRLTLRTPRLAVTGLTGVVGSVRMRMTVPGLAVTVKPSATGRVTLVWPSLKLAAGGRLGTTGTVRATLRRLALAMSGYTGTVGQVVLTLPVVRLDVSGYQPVIGVARLILPALRLTAIGRVAGVTGVTVPQTITMHTETNALSTYSNYPFNAFAQFNGVYLGASDAGIFALTGDTDNGAAIDAAVRVGITDFGTSFRKRLDRIYVGYRTDGDMVLSIFTDEVNKHDYRLSGRGELGLHGNHSRIGKGLAARYWQFGVSNRNGAYFDFNMIELKPTPLRRRVGGGDA